MKIALRIYGVLYVISIGMNFIRTIGHTGHLRDGAEIVGSAIGWALMIGMTTLLFWTSFNLKGDETEETTDANGNHMMKVLIRVVAIFVMLISLPAMAGAISASQSTGMAALVLLIIAAIIYAPCILLLVASGRLKGDE